MKALLLLALVSLPARAQLVNVHFQSSIHFMERLVVDVEVGANPKYRESKYELSFYEIINDKWIPTFSVKEDGIYGKDGKMTCRYDDKKYNYTSIEGNLCKTEPLIFGRGIAVEFFVTTFDSAKKSGTIKMDNKTYGFKILNFRSYHKKALWDNRYSGGKSFRELVKVEEHEKFSDEIYKAAYIDHNFLEYFSKENYNFRAAFRTKKKTCPWQRESRKREKINKKTMIHYLKTGRHQSEVKHLLDIEKKYNLHFLVSDDGGINLEKRGISMNLKGDELFSKLEVEVRSNYDKGTRRDDNKYFSITLHLKDDMTCEEFYKELEKEKIPELK